MGGCSHSAWVVLPKCRAYIRAYVQLTGFWF
jgi:hypothetical protein